MDPLFTCRDCDLDTEEAGEYYMLHGELWYQIYPHRHGMLCIGCVEMRLGRQLEPADFTDAPLNYPGLFPQSARLLDRLGANSQEAAPSN